MSTDSSQTSNTKRLQGLVAIITGGASGIGECCAKVFVKQEAKVVIADIQDELGNSLCRQLGSEQTISYIHCDVTCDSDVQNAVDLAITRYGKLDIMFSNAGIAGKPELSILSTENEDFKRVFDVNVYGAFLAAKHAARVMVPAKKGCIIFTASMVSVNCPQAPHPYVASKHALVGLAKNLCVELGQYGIRVNSISPYVVITPQARKTLSMPVNEMEDVICAAANLKKAVLEGEDVAEAAVYLGSNASKYVSGINLVVDGGFSLTNPSFALAMKGLIS
ncbi:secoisolariciresinol dehydrogenase [Manihot esculenta]|uniref:Uncharacterized protein n=1 Tax=Manihot esculenta TaxID=3983 RepID=A0A2C9V819_MANES|nr:secoisolariciresinol dehydrogenase [Manihot esculenta]OAY40803.1 hypothetical protein MANES_09G050000v8 [Manihot esculenta]